MSNDVTTGEKAGDRIRFASIETPFSAPNLIKFIQHQQYTALANTHASGYEEKDAEGVNIVTCTWVPHMANPMFTLFGMSTSVGDTIGQLMYPLIPAAYKTYFVGRQATLDRTNGVRATKMDAVIAYTDFGISEGMQGAIDIGKGRAMFIARKLPPHLMHHVFGMSTSSTEMPIVAASLLAGTVAAGVTVVARHVTRLPIPATPVAATVAIATSVIAHAATFAFGYNKHDLQ